MDLKLSVEQAQQIYRQAWNSHRLAKTAEGVSAAEEAMDALAKYCTSSGKPDAEWVAFANTLPGFVEFWAKVLGYVNTMVPEVE